MTTGEFTAKDWIERLAQALAELAKTQEHYRDELYWRRQQRVRSESERLQWSPFDHPSHALQSFYWHASTEGRTYEDCYGPLRAALAEVQSVLAGHPAWAGLVDLADGNDELQIRIVNRSGLGTLLGMIGGLMARGLEMPEDGFRVAAAELHGLLDPGGDRERIPGPGDLSLSVGYHVVLFYGLRVSEEVWLADDMALLPFEQLAAFVDENVLQEVAPAVIRYNGQKSVGALVKPFRWKPEFRERGDDYSLDWGGSFFEDAEAFVELLAMFHTAPVICLAMIEYCIHRTASSLLGRPHGSGGYRWGRSARSFDGFTRSTDLSSDALDEARKAFRERKSAKYRDCAPVIARLAEALARSGRFRTEDKILDVAIALERMYELEGGEISFKLKTMAACFLEASTEGRLRVFQDVEKLYSVRSGIVHKRKPQKQPSAEGKNEAFSKGFEVARRSVIKLLRDGPPPNWNEMVIAGTEPSAPKPGDGDGTTEPP